MSNESFKQKQNLHNEYTVGTNTSIEDTCEMKYTIDQQKRYVFKRYAIRIKLIKLYVPVVLSNYIQSL